MYLNWLVKLIMPYRGTGSTVNYTARWASKNRDLTDITQRVAKNIIPNNTIIRVITIQCGLAI